MRLDEVRVHEQLTFCGQARKSDLANTDNPHKMGRHLPEFSMTAYLPLSTDPEIALAQILLFPEVKKLDEELDQGDKLIFELEQELLRVKGQRDLQFQRLKSLVLELHSRGVRPSQ